MSRNSKQPTQHREAEDAGLDESPRGPRDADDEADPEASATRASRQGAALAEDEDDEGDLEVDDDDLIEEIDLDDLAAMEGPDA